MPTANKKIRVLVVDDSALIREMYSKLLGSDEGIEVVGVAEDPLEAREKIKQLLPDVITLDVEMPKMDGIAFLEKIMTLRPMPVIMASSLTTRGADITVRALELGAVDCIAKPIMQTPEQLSLLKEELIRKVKNAAQVRVQGRQPEASAAQRLSYRPPPHAMLIAIGSSTGGVEALHSILKTLPATIPPIVITQHMPPGFTASFARRLDNACAPHVQEAMHQQLIKPGNVYIANGSQHLRVGGRQGNWRCLFDDGPANLGHKPSVDVLFNSVAEHAGDSAVGVILTGMGKDGAAGLLNMKKAGAATIGQAERSCVVYGMPRAAKELGGVDKELTLNDIASGIIRLCERIKAA